MHKNMINLAEECKKKSSDIANYLIEYLNENKSFKLRSFYGESFALNLIDRHGKLTSELRDLLINEYKIKNKGDTEFHFEFNNYAFSDLVHRTQGDNHYASLYQPLKFKGTTCTNWTLLRSNVRLAEKIDAEKATRELQDKINHFQLKSGLILDDPGVKSFQYHCFSAAMLIEIFEKNKDPKVYNAFIRAVEFIRQFILKNGEALYVGRGQEQSFGLGVLIYILSKYYTETKNEQALGEIASILNFISKFQYTSGAFPLVFTGREKENPQNVDMRSTDFCGWYPYNNFFDYLPFLGYFLHKAYEVLEKLNLDSNYINPEKLKLDYRDSSFIRVNKEKYTAIISLPGGYWTNDLPFPLVMYKEKFITPMLGGEQFQKSLYSDQDLSLPITKWRGISWRKFGRGYLLKNTLIWISPFGILYRKYRFFDTRVDVSNTSLCWFPSEQSFSFLDSFEKSGSHQLKDENVLVHFSSKIRSIKKGYSAMGELNIIRSGMNVNISMELL